MKLTLDELAIFKEWLKKHPKHFLAFGDQILTAADGDYTFIHLWIHSEDESSFYLRLEVEPPQISEKT